MGVPSRQRLRTFAKEAAVKGQEVLRRRAGIRSRPSVLFADKFTTSLDTSSTVDGINSKFVWEGVIKSRKLTREGLIFEARPRVGPISVNNF